MMLLMILVIRFDDDDDTAGDDCHNVINADGDADADDCGDR